MHFTSASILLAPLIALPVVATPLRPESITTAGGPPQVGDIPAMISADATRQLQLAHFLENLEFQFFNASLEKFDYWNTTGYGDLVEMVNKTTAQEEVHLASLGRLLDVYHSPPIPPCQYYFPVNSTEEFLDVAHLVTSVGIGATIGLIERLAVTDPLLVGFLSSALPVESRQDAFFRQAKGELPNPAPFDTGLRGVWAYNLALSFIEPGSCTVEIPAPILPTLDISLKNPASDKKSAEWEFSWDPAQIPFTTEQGKQLLIGWVNQLQGPVYTPLRIESPGKGFAYAPKDISGVSFAVITVQQYETLLELTLGTMAGPAIVHC